MFLNFLIQKLIKNDFIERKSSSARFERYSVRKIIRTFVVRGLCFFFHTESRVVLKLGLHLTTLNWNPMPLLSLGSNLCFCKWFFF